HRYWETIVVHKTPATETEKEVNLTSFSSVGVNSVCRIHLIFLDIMEPPPNPASNLVIPSPIFHKRNRTESQSESASTGEHGVGRIVSFCRKKGHGFIKPDNGGDYLFVHVFEFYDKAITSTVELSYVSTSF
ncbi:Cold shock domain-containing protein, partial [Schistosoma japonicum]